jgi:hypothetical protein
MSVPLIIFCLVLLQTGAPNGSQAPSKPEEQPTTVLNPVEIGVSLDRIQRALAKPPAIKVQDATKRENSDVPLFRMSIEERKLTIVEILGPDFWRGPAPYGGMSHQEFLNMVTPKDVQGFAPYSNAEAATIAVTAFALQWGLKNAIRALQDAKDEREREAARQEVQQAVEALRKARREAGLPDR